MPADTTCIVAGGGPAGMMLAFVVALGFAAATPDSALCEKKWPEQKTKMSPEDVRNCARWLLTKHAGYADLTDLALDPNTGGKGLRDVSAERLHAMAREVNAACEGRCFAAHLGTYDFTASCNLTAAYQTMRHPWCDLAKGIMVLAFGGTGLKVSPHAVATTAYGAACAAA